MLFPKALAGQFDAVGVVDEPIEDGVGDGGVADDFIPLADRHLAGDDDRAHLVAVIDDFQQIAALLGVQRLRPPIVQDEQVHLRDLAQHSGVAAIGPCQSEGREQPRHAVIGGREVLPARFLTEGAGKPAFAYAAGTGNQ